MLRKYWPPIRFALIILIFISILILGISAIVKGVRLGSTDTTTTGASTTETTTEATLSQEEIQLQAQALIKKADEMALGFDYRNAISMLKDFKYYDSVPSLAQKVKELEELDVKLVSYPKVSSITHIFFHSLIVDPSRAFDGEYTQKGYNQYMTTVSEFKAILEEMYNKGYILVSPYDVAYEVTDEHGTRFVYGDIRIPEGRIPFILSQDDVNYYGYMIGGESGVNEKPIFANSSGDGFASRIVIGTDGYPTCEYMDKDGKVTTGEYDIVPILEAFIQEHPDFSYHGARAVLGMTGYEGVFGYRTKPSYETAMGTEAFQKEIREAQKVAQCLREDLCLDPRITVLGHIQRGGSPTARDRVAATKMGYLAVKLLMEGKSNRIVCTQVGGFTDVDMDEGLAKVKKMQTMEMDVLSAMTGL